MSEVIEFPKYPAGIAAALKNLQPLTASFVVDDILEAAEWIEDGQKGAGLVAILTVLEEVEARDGDFLRGIIEGLRNQRDVIEAIEDACA